MPRSRLPFLALAAAVAWLATACGSDRASRTTAHRTDPIMTDAPRSAATAPMPQLATATFALG